MNDNYKSKTYFGEELTHNDLNQIQGAFEQIYLDNGKLQEVGLKERIQDRVGIQSSWLLMKKLLIILIQLKTDY